jgi:hypothetical protein
MLCNPRRELAALHSSVGGTFLPSCHPAIMKKQEFPAAS